MDKENLYYLVERGTNSRILNHTRDPLIGDKQGIEIQKDIFGSRKEIISIKEYEDKYLSDAKTEPCASDITKAKV